MLSQYLEDKTEKGLNADDLDRALIPFASTPFTSSICYFITFSLQESSALQEARKEATGKLLSLISDIEKNFPPKSETDISGIEDLYR
ncbi:MAG: hypothetical protein A3G87_05395 [Omnitrophica bacterium RIFCSPLOWO2_12_FULL_50_11]|nr:MAG: hypothetical protein A3G87_05395 [Omnitrophica bacterium RIFCSPLOWO2_12_FULL_50_11]